MSRVHFLLILFLAALAQAQRDQTVNAPYKLLLINACGDIWKDLRVANGMMAMCEGLSPGFEIAIMSSAFMTLGTTVYNRPLTPHRVDRYLVNHGAYKGYGNIVNWDVMEGHFGIHSASNHTFEALISHLKKGSAYAIKYHNEDDPKNNGAWGLLGSVTCTDGKGNNVDYASSNCSFCLQVNHRDGSQSSVCSPAVNSYKDGPKTNWYKAYRFDPQQKDHTLF